MEQELLRAEALADAKFKATDKGVQARRSFDVGAW
jgi:hypothetical protein